MDTESGDSASQNQKFGKVCLVSRRCRSLWIVSGWNRVCAGISVVLVMNCGNADDDVSCIRCHVQHAMYLTCAIFL